MDDTIKVKKQDAMKGKLGKDVQPKKKVDGLEGCEGQDVMDSVAGKSGAKEHKAPAFDEKLGDKGSNKV